MFMPAADAMLAAAIHLHRDDNVAIAIVPLKAGDPLGISLSGTVCAQSIAPGHKVAVRDIPAGQKVLKYGQPIGVATKPIRQGEHVHSHNLADDHQVHGSADSAQPVASPEPLHRTFQGYCREDGRVGTRNYVALISTVNCSATVCKMIASRFDSERMRRWPNVDGIVAITHQTGCGMQYGSLKHEMLGRTLTGYMRHANVGASLIIGLGCEQNTSEYLAENHSVLPITTREDQLSLSPGKTPVMTMQQMGGTRRTVEKAERWLETLLDQANQVTRSTADAKHLKVALKCGGSDGYSGISANPAVGIVADRVVACGGTAILSETTEIYGAEHLLIARSRSPQVAQRLLDRIEWWKQHVAMYGSTIDNNPSVGNKAGGLTTITEKSLGAVSKSGSTTLEDVYLYAQKITKPGLVVMDTPGFDPACVTGNVAGGANVVLFTTGRGSCFGCKPVPSIKITSNSDLFQRLNEDMDFDAGSILQGEPVDVVGDRLFEYVLEVASGRYTASESLGLGDNEFVPWTVGPTL